MAFCTKCGRKLADGEVCTCQTTQAMDLNQTEQTVTPIQVEQIVSPIQVEQTTSSAEPNNMMAQATAISHGLLSYLKDFFTKPVAAAEEVVSEKSFITSCVLVGVGALIRMLYNIFKMVKYNSNGGAGQWLKSIFGGIVWWIVIPAAFVGILFVCAKYIEKQDVNIKTVVSVVAIPAIPLIVMDLIGMLQLPLDHEFFAVIFGLMNAAVGGMMIMLTGIGITKVIKVSPKFIYIIAIICATLWFANWLVSDVIFSTDADTAAALIKAFPELKQLM